MVFHEKLSRIPPSQFELPRRIHRLAELAYNLWWTWHPDAYRLFKRLNPELWEEAYHNPIRFLRAIDPEHLQRATKDLAYVQLYDSVLTEFDEYMQSDNTWYARQYPDRMNQPIAYFSTEFGLHESLPIYAGGLGILSGDHLKEASDLGMPLIAIGFLYTQGYFTQVITEDGWQEARYANLSFHELPVHPVLDDEGEPLSISIAIAGREIIARLWRIEVGRVPLYLLDTSFEVNEPADRTLTERLYTSDLEMRITQEILLGIGGVRALRMLGYNPAIWHMNEGHSAFILLERMRELVAAGRSPEEAQDMVKQTTIFTTHTPVPAGHDEFPLWLIDKCFSNYWPELGLDRETFIDLARHTQPWGDMYAMSVLAMRMSRLRNGVSELHGQVARNMWNYLWPDRKVEDVPIGHVTNGIHSSTWIAHQVKHLFDRYLPEDWMANIDDPAILEGIDAIPDEELWQTHRALKRRLVAYMRERARYRWIAGKLHPVQVIASGLMLNPYSLTIGFARRFATYKRASLVLSDPERLLGLLNQPGRPVQIIFAGKAHPADEPGKKLIQEVYRQVKRAENGGRLVFLEDYDMNVARYMLQGVDVWLNTPRRPNEASGTSGQKAALNGVLNFSILDGWWREGYNGKNGWAIGEDTKQDDPKLQDEHDAASLYRTLENEIIPLYYDRSADNIPNDWIGWMKESIKSVAPAFSMRRMVKEYIEKLYIPALPDPGD